ncbi:hypothetical protein ACWENO_13980 [Streptomyces sp. NPDC004436]
MTALPEPTVRPTRYEVSLLPEADINYQSYVVTVEYCGDDRWAVTRNQFCLGVDGTWEFGIKPYDRGDDWLNAHRFDLDTALKLAREAAPHVVCNGWTVADAIRLTAAEEADAAEGAGA